MELHQFSGFSPGFLVPSGKIHMEIPPLIFSIPAKIVFKPSLIFERSKISSSSDPSSGLAAGSLSFPFGNKTGQSRNGHIAHDNIKITSVVSHIKYRPVGGNIFQPPHLVCDPGDPADFLKIHRTMEKLFQPASSGFFLPFSPENTKPEK